MARLLGGHRIRAAHTRVIRVQLGPEHRQHEQPQRADREAEPAEHDAADRPARPGGAAAPRLGVGGEAEPDRGQREQQSEDRHVDPAVQVAESEHQADQAERAQQQRRQRPLAHGGVGGRQLPASGRHLSRLRPAPARWLVSGHRHLFCPLRRPPDHVP